MPRRFQTSLVALILFWAFFLAATVRAEGTYVDNQDGTITDSQHGLMWQRADDGIQRSWQEAVSYCASLDLAGHHDWALPKSYQLEGLIDTGHSPTIDPIFSIKASYYWTATDSTTDAGSAKYVNFFYGNSYTYNKDNPYYALCVREAPTLPGQQLAAVFAGVPAKGKPLAIHFTPTVTGGKPPYFYDWDFGDGATSSDIDPSHAFAKDGQYKVVLTVSDNEGAVAVASQEIDLPLPDLSALAPKRQADADRTGPSPAASTKPGAEAPPSPKATVTKPGTGPRGLMDILASGTQGEPYKDGALGHSLLAYAFARAISGEAAESQKAPPTAGELDSFLGQAIKSLSHERQTPTITRSGDDSPICSAKGSTYVLVVGIGHDLSGAALSAIQDAEFVRKSVEKACPRTQTLMLNGDHANRQDILQGLTQIGSMITADDTLIVYLGAPSGLDGGRLNWYVNDTSKDLPWFTGLYHDDLLLLLKTFPANQILVLGEKNHPDK